MRNMKPLYFSTYYFFSPFLFFFSFYDLEETALLALEWKKVRKVVRRMKVVVFFQQLYDQCFVRRRSSKCTKNDIVRKCWRFMI